jgi:predicted dehydrogenase
MSDVLRVAVVGPGGWGRQHTRIFSERVDTDLVAVVGRDPERTATEAHRVGARPYTDIHAMIEVEAPDLITVSLPNEAHFGPTRELVRTGIPLLVEKPLVFSLAEADTLLEEATGFFAINFNHRYAEPVLRAKHAITAGDIGDPVFATWRFGGEPNAGASPHKNIIETQCHGFDMLEYLLGPIVSVMAQMTNKTYGAYSTVAIALEFASGAVGTLLGSYDSSYAYPDTHRVEVNGTTGRLLIQDTVRSFSLSKAGDANTVTWQAGYFDDEARSFHRTFDRHVEDLLHALRAGAPPPIPASAGRRALLLAQRCIESFTTRRAVSTVDD